MQVYTWDWDWYCTSMKLLLPQVVRGQEYWYKGQYLPLLCLFWFHWNWQSICLCVALHVFVEFLSLKRQQVSNASSTNAAFLFSCLPRCPITKMSGEAQIHIVVASTHLGSMKYYAHFGCVINTKKHNITCFLCFWVSSQYIDSSHTSLDSGRFFWYQGSNFVFSSHSRKVLMLFF